MVVSDVICSFSGALTPGAFFRRAALVAGLVIGITFGVTTGSAHGATDSAASVESEPLKVVASFSILADMVEQVGGPLVQVHSLVGRDADAHVFNPSPKDTRELARADLVVINGLGFEGWIERLVKASGFKGPVVVATDGIEAIEVDDHDHGQQKDNHAHHNHAHPHHAHEHGSHRDQGHGNAHEHGSVDPHAWQSLRNAKVYVVNIRDALIEARPQASEAITSRATKYLEQIDVLDQTLQSAFAAIPVQKRKALISHDAFGYLARDYEIEFLPVQGWSTGREASASDVANLIRQVREGKVQAYFVENMSDARVLERIADETGARSGGALYSDALSAPGTEADTYLKMYQVNGQRLVDALQ